MEGSQEDPCQVSWALWAHIGCMYAAECTCMLARRLLSAVHAVLCAVMCFVC